MDRKIKIVGLSKESGSKYHRVELPLSLLNHRFPEKYNIKLYNEKFFTEEVVKDADIIYCHWTHLTRCAMLSLWRDKYGFKIVQDIDDYWELPEGHPSKEVVYKMIPQLKDQLILADVVISSTEFLESKVKYFNTNTVVRKNFLPSDTQLESEDLQEYNQFRTHNRDFFRNTKLNIGICGSVSHLPDWLSIQKEIKKLKEDKFIRDNVNFVVSGYSDNNEITKKVWDKVVNLFTYSITKSGQAEIIKPKIIKYSSPHNYLKLNYEPIDIMICPLDINDFNQAKSNLKILECGKQGIIPICNNKMYWDKFEQSNKNQYFVENSSIYNDVKKLVELWKRKSDLFKQKANEIQFNILNHNENLNYAEINKMDKLFSQFRHTTI